MISSSSLAQSPHLFTRKLNRIRIFVPAMIHAIVDCMMDIFPLQVRGGAIRAFFVAYLQYIRLHLFAETGIPPHQIVRPQTHRNLLKIVSN